MSILVGNPFFLDAGAGAGGAYEIERSLRFNSSDSAYLSRTMSSASSTYTLSMWVKRSTLTSNYKYLFSSGNAGIAFYNGTDQFYIFDGGTVHATTGVYRDTSAWYHILLSVSSNTGAAYINGTQVLSGKNTASLSTTANATNIGRYYNSGSGDFYFDGYIADVYLIDGQALTPSSFTEVSATTGQLIPKQYTGSFGTNGFWLKFSDNSAATATTLGKDYSGNSNNFTPNNLSVAELYSVYFDGSTNTSLSVPSGASISGTGDFTIEFWHKPVSFGSSYRIPYANDTAGGVSIGLNSSGTMFFGRSGLTIEGTTSNTVTFGQYNHFALTRSSGTFRMFINGTLGYTGTPSINYNSGNVRIGKDGLGNLEYVGEISALRSVAGTALYTSNFTAPARPLSQVSGTTLLACQTSALVDQSSNAYTITAVGNAHVFSNGDTIDSLTDTPTSYGTDTGAGGEVRGNYATLNSLVGIGPLSNGNLDYAAGGTDQLRHATIGVSSGKWYFETTITSVTTQFTGIGLYGANALGQSNSTPSRGYGSTGVKYSNGSTASYGATFTSGDVIGCAFDLDNGKVWFSKNGTWQASGDPVAGTNAAYTDLSGVTWIPTIQGGGSMGSVALNFGQRPFAYTAPSGFKALCDTNLPAPVVAKPSTVFDTTLYTGNGSTQTISGLGFSPDFAWFKVRNNTSHHTLYDIVRGATKSLCSSNTNAEATEGGGLSAFTSDGFSLSGDNTIQGSTNANGGTYVAWTWDAGSSTVTNTQGSITGGAQVRANPSAGFSIITFTMGSGSYTVGHGLNTAPSLLITKARSNTSSWWTYHASLGTGSYLALNSTAAAASDYSWGSAPTSTVFTANNDFFTNGYTFVVYAFSPVAGYSSFGSYEGSGSTQFVYTGFRPKFLIVKCSAGSSTQEWVIKDGVRNPYNAANFFLYANASDAEGSSARDCDFLSNGFSIPGSIGPMNFAGRSYIYIAFAESPFQYARAR